MAPLSDEQLQRYHDDGYLVCEGFLDSAEHARLSEWISEVSKWPSSTGRCIHHRELTELGPVLARTEQFLAHHDELHTLLTTGRLIEAVGQLIGEPAQVFKEKINYKHPGGGGFAPHQDAAAFKKFGSLHVTCLIAVDPSTIDNGCLWFAAGKHKDGSLPEDENGCLSAEVANALSWVAAPIQPGGVLFFSSFVPHKSPANNSDISRRSLYISYGKASEGSLRDAYYEDRHRVMQDVDAGRVSTIGHFLGKAID